MVTEPTINRWHQGSAGCHSILARRGPVVRQRTPQQHSAYWIPKSHLDENPLKSLQGSPSLHSEQLSKSFSFQEDQVSIIPMEKSELQHE